MTPQRCPLRAQPHGTTKRAVRAGDLPVPGPGDSHQQPHGAGLAALLPLCPTEGLQLPKPHAQPQGPSCCLSPPRPLQSPNFWPRLPERGLQVPPPSPRATSCPSSDHPGWKGLPRHSLHSPWPRTCRKRSPAPVPTGVSPGTTSPSPSAQRNKPTVPSRLRDRAHSPQSADEAIDRALGVQGDDVPDVQET